MSEDRLPIDAADILLYRGSGFIDWAIRAFDGTEVNHAAIALDNAILGEAGANGLQTKDIIASVRGNELTIVRRFAATDLSPVTARAKTLLAEGSAYAYQQIVLLAILAATRRMPLTGAARLLVRTVLDRAAEALNGFVDAGGRRSMICSEFVYRCYEEAVPGTHPSPFHLRVGGLGMLPASSAAATPLDWALTLSDDRLAAAATRVASREAAPPAVRVPHVDQLDAELAPLIVAYASESELADRDLPAVPLTAGPPREPVSDDDLLDAIVRFGSALQLASARQPMVQRRIAAGLATTARDALEMVAALWVSPDFVTPGDLLRSPSLGEVLRLPGGGVSAPIPAEVQVTAGDHTESENHPWTRRIPDHPPRTDTPEYIDSRRRMNAMAREISDFFYGRRPYEDHHGGGLWLKDDEGWFLVRNLAGIEWSAQFCADPAKVELLRQTARRVYARFPEAVEELGIRELLDTPVTDAAQVAQFTDSVLNASVPLPASLHVGVLPKAAGIHHYPTPVAEIAFYKYDDFDLWVEDEDGRPAAVVPVAARGSNDGRVQVVYASEGSPMEAEVQRARVEGRPPILPAEHPMAQRAFTLQYERIATKRVRRSDPMHRLVGADKSPASAA